MSDVEQRREVRVVAIGQEHAVTRHEPDEMFERSLDGREIFKNIRVVEFQVIEDRHFRQVMNKLAALVEKGGVVFVPLDDEPFAVRKTRALAEIVRDAADEETGIKAVVLEDPGEQ